MSTPRKLRALRAIKALLLQQVNGTGDYHHTLETEKVRIGCKRFSTDERPAVGINTERAEPQSRQFGHQREWQGSVYLDCFGIADDEQAETAILLEADILRALKSLRRGTSYALTDVDGEIGSVVVIGTEPISTPDATGTEGSSVELQLTTKEEY